eukprot:gnl/MRDRNA2_/MRDRNA2_134217_c0_seq1.p1 gnl/MRDRNA2_/MRDRNA2_134217_c0~~gnl/MRDRNA2_/MRDRNA2_134217_c0_seq1.p1  ORF type:complete len:191 (+),score=24.62 gnl/MRDRNA2_/MRDRNA2_134217_c0_seq1:28-600(+)
MGIECERTPLKMTSTLWILVLVGNGIVDCHAQQLLRGKANGVVPSSFFDVNSRSKTRLGATRHTSLFVAPPLQKFRGLSHYPFGRHVPRKVHVLSSLQSASELGAALAHQNAVTAAHHVNPIMDQASLFGLGLPELAVIGVAALLIFGPESLPGLGKQLGSTVRELKGAASEFQDELSVDSKTNSTSTSQ